MTSPPSTPHEIVVVDNASTDGSAAASGADGRSVTVIEQPRTRICRREQRRHPRHARRAAAAAQQRHDRAGRGDRRAGRHGCSRDRTSAVAGPRLVDGDGRAELSFGPMISPLERAAPEVTLALYRAAVAACARGSSGATRREQYVDWVSGACLLVRRADAEAGGPARRAVLSLHGGRRLLRGDPRAGPRACCSRRRPRSFTSRGRSRATAPAAMNVAYRRSQLAFYEKHHPRWAPLLRLYLR